jgi:signal transduction histidine kinase
LKKIFFLILSLTTILSQGQISKISGTQPLKTYFNEEYNGSKQVWCAVQDLSGKMFFGTSNSIVYFDGSEWNKIALYDEKCIRSLGIDTSGRIYVGSIGEFGYLQPDSSGIFQFVSLLHKINEDDKKFNDIWQISVYKNKVAFLSAAKFFVYDISSDKVTVENHSLAPIFGESIYDKLFIIKDSIGVSIYQNDSLYDLPGMGDIDFSNGLISLLPYGDDKILIANSLSGLWLYDLSKLPENPKDFTNYKSTSKLLTKFNCEVDDIIAGNRLYTCTRINDSLYAFGSFLKGVVIMKQDGSLYKIIDKSNGLPTYMILKFYTDNSQGLWTLTGDGIMHVDIISPVTFIGKENGILGKANSIIFENNRYYISTMKGVYSLSKNKENNNTQPKVTSLTKDENYYWDIISIKNNVFTIDYDKICVIKNDKVSPINGLYTNYAIAYNPKFPNYIFHTINDVVCATKLSFGKNQNIIPTETFKFEDANMIIKEMFVDENGTIWFFNNFDVLHALSFNDNTDISNYKLIKADTSVYYDDDFYERFSILDDGLYIWGKNKLLKPFINTNGEVEFTENKKIGSLFKDKTKTLILRNDNDIIYANTNNGICRIIKKGDSFVKDFTPFRNIFDPIRLEVVNDLLWIFTAQSGIYIYDKNVTKKYDFDYQALIREVEVNGDSLIFQGEYLKNDNLKGLLSILKQPSDKIPEIRYANNSIKFSFSAAYFNRWDKTQYKYRLDGFDEDVDYWSKWTSINFKEYTKIREGTYTFKVKARNVYDAESIVAEYTFRILPPWYRTWWAFLIYIALSVAIVYFIVYLNGKRLMRLNVQLEKTVFERTADLNDVNAQLEEKQAELILQKQEITTQAKMLEETNLELEKLTIVASETDNAVMILDKDLNFEWVNQGFHKMYNFLFKDTAAIKGQNLLSISKYHRIQEIISNCKKTKTSISYENLIGKKNNVDIWVQTTITPIIEESGLIYKFVAIDSDITKLKQAETIVKEKNEEVLIQRDKLKQKNKKLQEMDEFKKGMTSMIVHDLKNPLNSILNTPKSLSADDKVLMMQQSGKQMLNMVLNILDVHKYEDLAMKVELKEYTVAPIANNAINQVLFLSKQKDISISNSINSGIVCLLEEETIERVFVNLLTNAIKYSPVGGTIKLFSKIVSKDHVRICVSDEGEGIAKDKINLVFQRFGQIVAKKSGTIKSTGLGLAFCKMAVEAHGGEIWVKSDTGEGSIFCFTLKNANSILKPDEDQKLENNVKDNKKRDVINFTEEEKKTLIPVVQKLKEFTVYETDDIQEITAPLKANTSTNISKWVNEVEEVLLTLNQNKYLEIINIS